MKVTVNEAPRSTPLFKYPKLIRTLINKDILLMCDNDMSIVLKSHSDQMGLICSCRYTDCDDFNGSITLQNNHPNASKVALGDLNGTLLVKVQYTPESDRAKYPQLCIHHHRKDDKLQNTAIIVFMTDPEKGVVLFDSSKKCKIGYYSVNWASSIFEYFPGTITLSNTSIYKN